MPVVVATIVLVGISGAVVLTVVYATGARAARFTAWRLLVVFAGLCLVTIPVPLLIYYRLERGRALTVAIGALFVLAVIALALGAPDDPDDEP